MHEIVHLAEQLRGPIWLGDEAAVVGNLSAGGRPLARSNDQQDVGPTGVNLARQTHAVERPWHLNVREE